MNDDLKTYIDKMPFDLKQRYEFMKYKFGENWNDNFYRKPLDYLEQNEKILNPITLVQYKNMPPPLSKVKPKPYVKPEVEEKPETEKRLEKKLGIIIK